MIERQIIDGRPATVAYFDADFNPVNRTAPDHYAKVLFDDGEMLILKSPGEAVDPKQLVQITDAWNTALMILDHSELALRDVIERELSSYAGLDHLRYSDAMLVADRLMKKITRIRTKALKAAFRLVRGSAP